MIKNAGITLLTAHSTLHRLAWGSSGVFVGMYLYRAGISLAGVFLVYTVILAVRLVFRPLLLPCVALLGLRRTLVLSTFLQGIQYPMLALVHGVSPALALYCAVAGAGAAFYFTTHHAMFAALGDVERRGTQVGVRQALMAVAAILGPATGGVTLEAFGPWAAFGAAAAIEVAAVVPLLALPEPKSSAILPGHSRLADKTGIWLLVTDGWITNTSLLAWSIIMFTSLDGRFDAVGGAMATAALAGAVGGAILGRTIDMGHARRAAMINATLAAGSLVLKAVCGTDAVAVVAVAVVTTAFGGLYLPTLMTAFYNEAKASPDPLRFQIAAEGGWDVGGILVTIIAAVLCLSGAPLQIALLLALPMVPIQAWLLDRSYAKPWYAKSI